MRRPVPLVALVLLAACAGAGPRPGPVPAAEPIRLTVFATADVHGALAPYQDRRADGTVLPVGGAALLGGYLGILRAENPGGVIAVDAGDLLQGSLAAGLTEGGAVIEAFSALGYDAVTLGNHEFDHGPVGPALSPKEPGDDPTGALAARAAEARFPFLAANVIDRRTGERPPWLRASATVVRQGLTVGIVGAATVDTPVATLGENVAHLAFGPAAPAVAAEAGRLRAAGADLVILVFHDGAACEPGTDRCEGPLVDAVRALPAGTIDLAIGGHHHQVVDARVAGVPVIEPGALGRGFAVIDLAIDPVSRKVLADHTRSEAAIPACGLHVAGTGGCDPAATGPVEPARFRGHEVKPDPEVAAVIGPHLAREAQLRDSPLGASLPRALGRDWEGESALGDLVTDALLAAVPDADLAVTNSGGLRADLPAGPLTYGHAYGVIPFENGLAVLTLTGAEVREMFRLGYAGLYGSLQVAGATVEVRRDGPAACAVADVDGDGAVTPADRDRIVAIRVGGAPLDPAKLYRVVTNDYLARGGGGFDSLVKRLPPGRVRLLSDRPIFREVLVAALRDRDELPVPSGAGRVLLGGTEPRCPPGR